MIIKTLAQQMGKIERGFPAALLISTALFCCFILSPTPVLSAEWVYIRENAEVHVYYDKGSLVNLPNGNVQAWFKIEYKNKILKDCWEFNCEERKMSLISYADFDRNGRLLEEDTLSEKEWKPVRPETTGETRLQTICLAAQEQRKKNRSFTLVIRSFISDATMATKPLWLFCTIIVASMAVLYSFFSLSKYLWKVVRLLRVNNKE